jgi:hypothetical protein
VTKLPVQMVPPLVGEGLLHVRDFAPVAHNFEHVDHVDHPPGTIGGIGQSIGSCHNTTRLRGIDKRAKE